VNATLIPMELLRVPEGKELPADFETDEMSYWKDPATGEWWVYIPGCGAGRCPNHHPTEHEDGTVTFHGSILMNGHHNGQRTARHGFIERGVWREC